ncbi:MAG TPA: TetR/AcrR family transcriptional regulator [Aquiluna sp.]
MLNQGAKPRRGRPVTTDPNTVSLAALKLFAERGIETVTMDEVAVVAGISRSNLFRLFPSKAAVVWGGVHQFQEELEKRLSDSESADLISLLHSSWVGAMEGLDESLETLRLRLKLIGSSPEVYGWGQGQLDQVRQVIEASVVKNGGDTLRARTVSAAIVSASMAIMIHWAQSDDPRTPSQILDEGFQDFEALFSKN